MKLKLGHRLVTFHSSLKAITNKTKRLIPDTENYVHEIFQGLGLADPSSSSTRTPSSTPTPSVKAEQGHPENLNSEDHSENMKPTPTTHITYQSSTSYTPTYDSNGAGFTHTVKHQESSKKPIENIQLMHGWNQDRKLTSEDLPLIFDAVYQELKHRVGNMIDSSDEVGLDKFMGGL